MSGELKISYLIAGAALSVLLLVLASLSALSLRYPLVYRDEILIQSKSNGLSAELVAAVVWTESKFDASAVSGKGACGLAVAAYNAGEGNVTNWIKQNLEEIPFPETDMYVKRVMSAKNVYKARLKDIKSSD